MIPSAVLEKHAGPFAYGVSDCVRFAIDASEAICGAQWRIPAYSSYQDAVRLLSRKSLSDRAGEAGALIPAAEAEPGDIVIAVFEGIGQICGVADPPYFWVKSQNGIMPIEMNLANWVIRCLPQ